jgi:phosphatidylglycerophosphatase C
LTRGLALFDFDGTITKHDTLLELIKFQKGVVQFYFGMLWLSPVLISLKLKLISKAKAKETVLTFFFANQPLQEFQNTCNRFMATALPGILRKAALTKIEKHLNSNDRVIVVSASAYNWVEEWCRSINVELIATHLEFKSGLMTGKLGSLNCNDEEKVRRIKEYINIEEYSPIYAYGNSSGDRPMLALADYSFFRKF